MMEDIVDLLINGGADRQLKNRKGRQALSEAVNEVKYAEPGSTEQWTYRRIVRTLGGERWTTIIGDALFSFPDYRAPFCMLKNDGRWVKDGAETGMLADELAIWKGDALS